jgi:hypothetical protein
MRFLELGNLQIKRFTYLSFESPICWFQVRAHWLSDNMAGKWKGPHTEGLSVWGGLIVTAHSGEWTDPMASTNPSWALPRGLTSSYLTLGWPLRSPPAFQHHHTEAQASSLWTFGDKPYLNHSKHRHGFMPLPWLRLGHLQFYLLWFWHQGCKCQDREKGRVPWWYWKITLMVPWGTQGPVPVYLHKEKNPINYLSML